MGMSPVMNPYGGPLLLCDKMLGNAYETVKFVARHMNFIRYISDNMEALVALANGNPLTPGVASGAALLIPGITYAPDTSVSSPTLFLGALADFGEGQWVEIYDAMGNAAANPILVQVAPDTADTLIDHGGVAAASGTINSSNTITRLTKRNGAWRIVQYGA